MDRYPDQGFLLIESGSWNISVLEFNTYIHLWLSCLHRKLCKLRGNIYEIRFTTGHICSFIVVRRCRISCDLSMIDTSLTARPLNCDGGNLFRYSTASWQWFTNLCKYLPFSWSFVTSCLLVVHTEAIPTHMLERSRQHRLRLEKHEDATRKFLPHVLFWCRDGATSKIGSEDLLRAEPSLGW